MEIYRMKYFWIVIFIISVGSSCNTKTHKKQEIKAIDENSISFSFDQSPVDFTVSDSSGFSLTFHKHLDSTRYHFMRLRKPDEVRSLKDMLPTMASLWKAAEDTIDIQLSSLNIGYPLEYDDVLTNQIQVFSSSEKWLNHLRTQGNTQGNNVDYALVSEIMYANNIFPIYELLADFGYKVTGFSIEKVGFVQPERLVSLGFDESLTIPVPYMVWVEVQQTN